MFQKIAIAVTFIIAALVSFVFFQPNTYEIGRTSAPIKATPPEVYAQIADFHNWTRWSPWHQLDPTMKQTYGGPLNGVGSTYEWSSPKDDVGSGRMEIMEAKAPSAIKIKLDFLAPMQSSAITDFKIAQTDSGGAQVTWTIKGDADFMTKAMSAFGMMDKMIGTDFDKGLSQLKELAEQ